ncbi:MAG: polyprenyl synthetase family protein [Thermodesulfovibrionales bacterium]|nr:polyprenyl synthetase family protein [Thermodesulfovibrionales bacterium]
MDIKSYLKTKKQLVDNYLMSYFNDSFKPSILKDSMVYSLLAGGKRIRPILCMASYEVFHGNGDEILPYASALEFIHTYSLIHDDLPAMDNDDLRRGKPTNHKVFGEGMAILAGDGLLTEAFSIFSNCKHPCNNLIPFSAHILLRVINDIAKSAGLYGMVAGQAQDLLSEGAEPDESTLLFIHTHKTSALITSSVKIGAILARAEEEDVLLLTKYGVNIGLAFQIVDDIIDITESTETLGKTKGADEKKKKMTYPALYGLEEAKKKADNLIETAIKTLESFDEKAEPLRQIALYLKDRKH